MLKIITNIFRYNRFSRLSPWVFFRKRSMKKWNPYIELISIWLGEDIGGKSNFPRDRKRNHFEFSARTSQSSFGYPRLIFRRKITAGVGNWESGENKVCQRRIVGYIYIYTYIQNIILYRTFIMRNELDKETSKFNVRKVFASLSA